MPEDWPLIERALINHLPTVTTWPWQAPGRHDLGDAFPIGIIEQRGGDISDLDAARIVEVTVVAGTRSGCWAMAQQVDVAILRGLNPGGADGVYVDEAACVFGWAIDDDWSTPDYCVATATFTLTVRPQADPPEGN